MTKMAYITKNFREDTLRLIALADEIVEEYESQGFVLTLRQLYYQFVARDLIPNNQRSYDKLGRVVSDARLAGLISWTSITDRTRNMEINPHWSNPSKIIASAAQSYGIDLWSDQNTRVEVWIEKDALIGVIEDICNEWDVGRLSCRGYVSQSEMWQAAMRFRKYAKAGQGTTVLHLGDHDPSGIDMTRDVQERLSMLSGYPIRVKRLALSRDQVDENGCPPNPAKLTDPRAGDYIAEHGRSSWELDALSPPVIVDLIDDAIGDIVDHKKFKARQALQERQRDELTMLSERYGEAVAFLKDNE